MDFIWVYSAWRPEHLEQTILKPPKHTPIAYLG